MESPQGRVNFVRLEYWNIDKVDWVVGHAGISLMNPTVYVEKATTDGTIVRAVNLDTGEIMYGFDGFDGADLL